MSKNYLLSHTGLRTQNLFNLQNLFVSAYVYDGPPQMLDTALEICRLNDGLLPVSSVDYEEVMKNNGIERAWLGLRNIYFDESRWINFSLIGMISLVELLLIVMKHKYLFSNNKQKKNI